MLEQAEKNSGRSWRADPLLVAGVVLIGLQAGVRAVVALGSYWWQDDLYHLSLLQRAGLTRGYVVRGHDGHLEIGANLVYGLLGRDPGSSFLPAALILVALQLTASCLLLAVLRQLFGRSPWILVPFTVYLFTPMSLTSATWLAAGLQTLPLQIALLTALLGGVRAYRMRSAGWAAVSVAGTATGLIFSEKAVLVLPALVAVLVLVEEAGTPWRRSLRRVADSWPFLLPHALLVAAFVPIYLSVVGTSTLDPDPGSVVPATAETVVTVLVPGLFGGPWTSAGARYTVAADPGTVLAVVLTVLAVAVLAVSIRLRGARAVKAWILVAGYLVVVVSLVRLTRAEGVDVVARDPRYIADALPVIAIGCCAAFSGPRRPAATDELPARPARPVGAAAAVSALLLASCLLTTSLVVDTMQNRSTREYVAGVLEAMDAAPDVSVVSNQPPSYVTRFAAFDLEDTLRALGQERVFDRPGTDMRMFDGDAVLRPITLLEPIMRASGPVEGCGWALSETEQPLGDVPIWFGPQVLRLTYDSPSEVTLHVAVGEDEQDLTVPPGRGQAMFVVTREQGPVTARASGAPAGDVCVDDAVVGTPWPEGLAGS